MSNKMKNTFLLNKVSTMYLNADVSDVNFVINSHKIPAHKNLLASASPVFHAMFFGPMKEKGDVHLNDTTVGAFEEFLRFCYLDEVELSVENILDVARLADKYDMMDYLNSNTAYLKSHLTFNNMVWGYQLAEILQNEELKLYCQEHIANLALSTFKSESFLQCDRDMLRNILKMQTLKCSESDILKACLDWAKTACEKNGLDTDTENLKAQLGDCFHLIRIGAINAKELGQIVSSHTDFFSRDELVNIICATEFNNNPRGEQVIDDHTITGLLVCDRDIPGIKRQMCLDREESTVFRPNIDVYLHGFNFAPIQSYDLIRTVSEDFTVTIFTETLENPRQKIISGKYVTNITDAGGRLMLTDPMRLQTTCQYEIILQRKSNQQNCYHTSVCKGLVKVDSELTIFFDVSFVDEYGRVGLVKHTSGLTSKLYLAKNPGSHMISLV